MPDIAIVGLQSLMHKYPQIGWCVTFHKEVNESLDPATQNLQSVLHIIAKLCAVCFFVVAEPLLQILQRFKSFTLSVAMR